MTKMKPTSLLSALLLFYLTAVNGADLRGKLVGLPEAKLNVSCGGFQRGVNISNAGGFHVTDLPSARSCYFTLSHGQAISVRIPFNTKQNVTDYQGIIRKVGNKVIVIRK